MRRLSMVITAALVLFGGAAAPASAWQNPIEGLYLHGGLNRIPEFDSRIVGIMIREEVAGNIFTANFLPDKNLAVSLGADYLFDLGGRCELGLGFEYNSNLDLVRNYENNMLGRRGSSQVETYEGLGNTPLYLAWRYNFQVRGRVQPFLAARLGCSFNRMKGYTLGFYEEGPADPATGRPTEFAGEVVYRHTKAKDLRSSPYYGLGFGCRIRDNWYVEGLYSWTAYEFRLLYPTDYTLASGEERSFTVNEIHQATLRRFQFTLGYNYSRPGSRNRHAQESADASADWRPLRGLSVRLGANANLPTLSRLCHTIEKTNIYGEGVHSLQHTPENPVDRLTPALGLDYTWPVLGALELGGGLELNFARSYERVQVQSGKYVQVALEDFTSTAPYFAARYRFASGSDIEPYLLGRVGYSFNDINFTKYINGKKAAYLPDKVEGVRNGAYLALGLGSMLTRHLFLEGVFVHTHTGFDMHYVNVDHYGDPYGQTEHFKTGVRTIQLNLGYRF